MPEMSQEQKDAQQHAIRLIFAYREFFGVDDGHRTALQKLVVDDMKARARLESPIFIRDGSGHLDPLRAAIAEGGRIYMLNLLEIIKTDPNEPQPTATVKK